MNRSATAMCALLYAALMATNAHAFGGRIAVNGAVVTPTCSPAKVVSRDRTALRDVRTQCPQSPSSTTYTLHIEPAKASKSRLVEYYDGYVRASGSGEPVWVATQTYE